MRILLTKLSDERHSLEIVREDTEHAETLWLVEGAVGLMTSAVKAPPGQAFPTIRGYYESQRQTPPEWCTDSFIADVSELMRRLTGEWKATPYGKTMTFHWTEFSRP